MRGGPRDDRRRGDRRRSGGPLRGRRWLAVGALALLALACGDGGDGGDGSDGEGADVVDDGSDRGGEVVRFEVGPERVPCEGVGPQECLQVRRLPDGDWELFYGEIEGFVHEPGVATELLVRITEVDDPPADGSSLAYELVEVVERREGDGPT